MRYFPARVTASIRAPLSARASPTRILRPSPAGVEQLRGLDRAPGEAGGETAADRLHLGQLRHRAAPPRNGVAGQRRVAAGEPAERAGPDVGHRPIVAPPAVAGERRQQRRVLARVVGVRAVTSQP